MDNFLYSFKSKKTLHEIGFEIDIIMTLHNLNLQLPFSTCQTDHYDFKRDHPHEVILGYSWDKIKDVLSPHTTISHKKGAHGEKGILLSDLEFSPEQMTKRLVLSILSSLYDPLGIFYSILKMALKALYSQVCLLIPGNTKTSYDLKIISACPELANICSSLCNQLTNLKSINPLQRNAVPHNYEVSYLIVCKDGSGIGHSATIHIVSEDGTGHSAPFSRIVRANNRVKIASAPTNESQAYILGLYLVMVQLQATYHMYKDSVDTLPIYIVGDSQSALLALKGGSRDVHLRSVFSKCLDLGCEIIDKYDKVDLRFVWAQARLNVADLN